MVQKHSALPFIIGIFMCMEAPGQNFLMDGNPVFACGGTFYDNGGATGPYAAQQKTTTTICSGSADGSHIRLDFADLNIAPGDLLCVYDGPDVMSPLLACSDEYQARQSFIVQATAINNSGCLTLHFESDAQTQGDGWMASMSCHPSCQQIVAALATTDPPIVPADTGWIDICPNERIFFTGKGIYPQNDLFYHQDDQNVAFEWTFGDGQVGFGPETSHRFSKPGGYLVQLFLKDSRGCTNTNLISQRVRVAPRPVFTRLSAYDSLICAGDTIRLKAAVTTDAGDAHLGARPGSAGFAVAHTRSDSLALPDGIGVPYQAHLYFTDFSPGSRVADASDIERICVNMEHSWMRDLSVELRCPSGQSVNLQHFAGKNGSQVLLGEPNDKDFFTPIPGKGYEYCWTPSSIKGSWGEYANTILGANGGVLPPGDYAPENAFDALKGCPLNGAWTLTMTDLWPVDNGFLFSWGIDFKPSLYPQSESYAARFLSWGWRKQPSIYAYASESIAAAPVWAGSYAYTFAIEDDFNCIWDTALPLTALPPTHPDCGLCAKILTALPDTAICPGETVQLHANFSGRDSSQVVQFETYADYPLGHANHPHNNPYRSAINVGYVGIKTLTQPIAQIKEVCVDIETDFAGDLNLMLQAPDGQLLELSTGNGGSGKDYRNTCFSPKASTPVAGSAAPFNGLFAPEGSWNNLANAAVDGLWKLLVSDGFGVNQSGRVKSWRIAFNSVAETNFSWEADPSLSCLDCETPLASPLQTTSYFFTLHDNFGCTLHDTATVFIHSSFPAPAQFQIADMRNGVMTWRWNPVQGANGYEININNKGWQHLGAALLFSVYGLVAGDTVHASLRATTAIATCTPEIANRRQVYVDCDIKVKVDTIFQISCHGKDDGFVQVSVTGAQGPPTFLFDGKIGPFVNNKVGPSPPGIHFVIAKDTLNCRDSIGFEIVEPPGLGIDSFQIKHNICNGAANGALRLFASGGRGPLTYEWSSCDGGAARQGAVAANLKAGCYRFTATDAFNCTTSPTYTIEEPPPLLVIRTSSPASCFGASDGSARIEHFKDHAPYSYLWDNGATTPATQGLSGGLHNITVTDSTGCETVIPFDIYQPPRIEADSFSVVMSSCFNSADGRATVFPKGGSGSGYQYLWSDNAQNKATATQLNPGVYSVTITDAKGCTGVAQTTLNGPPPLTVQILGVVKERCANSCDASATFSINGGERPYTIQWDQAGIVSDTQSVQNLCAGMYKFTVSDAGGCSIVDTLVVDPVLPFTIQFSSVAPLCAGDANGIVMAGVSNAKTPLQYLWSNNQTGMALLNVPCGLYSLTVTDDNNCTGSASFNLPCPAPIQIDSIVAAPARCAGEANGQITVFAKGGSGKLSYLWNDPNKQFAALAVDLFAGAYAVTVSDENACSATANATVTEPPPLSVSVQATPASCLGGSDGMLEAIGTGGVMPYTYEWSDKQTGSKIGGLSAGSYFLTLTDRAGCKQFSQAIALTEPATAVTANATQIKPACFQAADGIAEASASGGSGAPYAYQWSSGQTTALNQFLGKGDYTVTVKDRLGCSATTSITISEYDSISVNLITLPPSCFGGANGQAAVNKVAGGAGNNIIANYRYQWGVAGAPDGISVNNLRAGQTYTLTVSDQRGCQNKFNFFIIEPPKLALRLDTKPIACFGASSGEISAQKEQGDHPIAAYRWSNQQTSPTITGLSNGFYAVTATDTKGCTASASVTLPEPPPLLLSLSTTQLACLSDKTGRVSSSVTGGAPEYSYVWNTGAKSAQISDLPAGKYDVTVSDKNACTTVQSATIEAPKTPEIRAEIKEPRCNGDANGSISIRATGGKTPYQYAFGDDNFGASTVYSGLKAGQYLVKVKEGNGCVVSDTIELSEPPAIEVSLGETIVLEYGDSIVLNADVQNAVGRSTFRWSSVLADTAYYCQDPANCESIVVKPAVSNDYRVLIVDSKGCSGTALVRVSVEKPRGIYVPTGFTPNDDQSNDLLVVYGKSRQVKEILIFRIYDRWGSLVYEDHSFPVNEETRGWDGRFRGQNCQAGLYVWHIEAVYQDGFRESLKGQTELIR